MGAAVVVTVPPVRRALTRRVMGKVGRIARGAMWRLRLGGFGRGSSIAWPAHVVGGESIQIGRDVEIWQGARLQAFRAARGVIRLSVGSNTAIHAGAHIGAAESVTIGCGVLIAAGVYITDHDHDFSDPGEPPISHGRLLVRRVNIGNYVWIGERVMVLKGVTIGEYSIVGAGSIVTRDVPPYSIAVGCPARPIKQYDHDLKKWVPVGKT